MVFPTPVSLVSARADHTIVAECTEMLMLPYIGFHTDTIVGMLSEKSKPHLYGFRMTILDLDQPPQCNSFEVLLAFLENEVAPRHCPAFCDAREWDGTAGWQL